MDSGEQIPWSGIPSVDDRTTFLKKMESLASKVSASVKADTAEEEEELISEDKDMVKLRALFNENNFQEAFFYARRLVAQGDNWAEEWMLKAREQL